MAGLFSLFDKQSSEYAAARPSYPREWFSKLASLTSHHHLAWDVGTGSGQAAVSFITETLPTELAGGITATDEPPRSSDLEFITEAQPTELAGGIMAADEPPRSSDLEVADHYDQVIGTDVSKAQLKHAIPHSRVRYVHMPLSTPIEDIVSTVGGEGSVDLVTVAQAIHWFDLPCFYSIVNRVLRKPGGVIAAWCYDTVVVDPSFDQVLKRVDDSMLPFWDQKVQYVLAGYRTLPFPFQSIGWGCEGESVSLDMEKDVSFGSFLGMLSTQSAVVTAKDRGVHLLSEEVVRELEAAWGGFSVVRKVTYKAYMLAGMPKMEG